MIGTAVSASLVSLLGVVGATIIILVLILWMLVIILKVSIVDMLSKLISDYKLEKEKHQTEMRMLREQREKEVEKIINELKEGKREFIDLSDDSLFIDNELELREKLDIDEFGEFLDLLEQELEKEYSTSVDRVTEVINFLNKINGRR